MSVRNGHMLLKHAAVTNKAIIRSVFRKHNHTDRLTGIELKAILMDLELPKEIFDEDTIDALMLLLDADASGNVDFTEFFDWWSKMCGGNVEDLDVTIINLGQLYAGMKQFSDEGDVSLNFDGFAALWEYCGNEMEPVNDVFDQLDADGSGSITFSELAHAFGFVGNTPEFDKEHFAAIFDAVDVIRDKQRNSYLEKHSKLNNSQRPVQIQKFRNKLLDENGAPRKDLVKTVPKYERRTNTPTAGTPSAPAPKKKLQLKLPTQKNVEAPAPVVVEKVVPKVETKRQSTKISQEEVDKLIKEAEVIQKDALKKLEEANEVELQRVSGQLNEAKQKLQDQEKLQKELELARIKIQTLEQTKTQPDQNNESIEKLRLEHNQNIETLRSEQNQNIEKLRSENEIERKRLEAEIKQTKEAATQLSVAYDMERKKLEAEVEELKRRPATVVTNTVVETNNSGHLVEENKKLVEEREKISQENKKIVEDREKISQERDTQIEEVKRIRAELLKLRTEYEQLEQNLKQEKESHSTLNKTVSDYKEQIEKQQKELQDNKRVIEKLKRDITTRSMSVSGGAAVVSGANLIGSKWDRKLSPKSYQFSDEDTTIRALHDYVDGAAVSNVALGTTGTFKWEHTIVQGGGATYIGVVTNQHAKNKSLRTSQHAWAIRLEGGILFENGKQLATPYWENDVKIEPGCKISVVADMNSGTISFLKDGVDMGGVAFRNVPSCVYPAVTVYHRGVVSTDFNSL